MSKIPAANKIIVALSIPIVIAIPFIVSAHPPPASLKIWVTVATVVYIAVAVFLKLRERKGRI